MNKARAIQTGDQDAGARLEYVRGRRVFRLGGWHSGGRSLPPLEVPLASFLRQLGVGADETGVAPVYLLLAGLQGHPSRALRHVTFAFPGELEARHAFRRLRSQHQLPDEWAQVVAVSASHELVPVCWFGTPGQLGTDVAAAGPGGDTEAEMGDEVGGRGRRWVPRRAREGR